MVAAPTNRSTIALPSNQSAGGLGGERRLLHQSEQPATGEGGTNGWSANGSGAGGAVPALSDGRSANGSGAGAEGGGAGALAGPALGAAASGVFRGPRGCGGAGGPGLHLFPRRRTGEWCERARARPRGGRVRRGGGWRGIRRDRGKPAGRTRARRRCAARRPPSCGASSCIFALGLRPVVVAPARGCGGGGSEAPTIGNHSRR